MSVVLKCRMGERLFHVEILRKTAKTKTWRLRKKKARMTTKNTRFNQGLFYGLEYR